MDPAPGPKTWNGKSFATAVRAGEQPLKLMKEFVGDWLGATPAADLIPAEEIQAAEKRLGRALPAGLHRWYEMIGGRETRLRANADHLRLPGELGISNGVLDLVRETQGVWTIGIQESDLHLTDPPAWIYHSERVGLRRGALLNPSFGAFALEWALYSVKYDVPFTAESDGRRVDLTRLMAEVAKVPSSLWRIWGDDGLTYHAGEDLVVEVAYLNKDQWAGWIGVSARTKTARERATALVKSDWKLYEKM